MKGQRCCSVFAPQEEEPEKSAMEDDEERTGDRGTADEPTTAIPDTVRARLFLSGRPPEMGPARRGVALAGRRAGTQGSQLARSLRWPAAGRAARADGAREGGERGGAG